MYKPDDKFIIEIAEVYSSENLNGGLPLYRIKGFNTLTFNKEGLDRLESYNKYTGSYKEGYLDGYDDGYKDGKESEVLANLKVGEEFQFDDTFFVKTDLKEDSYCVAVEKDSGICTYFEPITVVKKVKE